MLVGVSERKPPGTPWKAWIDHAIHEAERDGQFDDLPGKGKPLPDLGEGYDPDWWTKKLIQREKVSVLPPALRIKARVAAELPRIRNLVREEDVRIALGKLNAEIGKVNRTVTAGPSTQIAPLDADAILERWRMEREIELRAGAKLPMDQVLALYRANEWSSAERPEQLEQALANSDCVISAWHGEQLVGLGNAISDGHLVVYYPHLLVLPTYQRRGIGRRIVEKLLARYRDMHQHVLMADGDAIAFYERCGFVRAGHTQSMWIYSGKDH